MPDDPVSDIHEQMARLSRAGDTEEEIAAKLRMTGAELGKEWAQLEASLKVLTQEESVEIVLAGLLARAREIRADRGISQGAGCPYVQSSRAHHRGQ